MPLVVLTLGVAVVVALARGGRFHRIADSELRGNAWLLAGLAIQLLTDQLAGRGGLGEPWTYVLLLASQLLVLLWVGLNWWRPGMALVFIGFAMNATVIAANGAMPVDPDAMAALGLGELTVPPGKHTLMTGSTRLPLLADIIPLPILRTVVSWGDVVIAAGLIPLVHHLMAFRPAAERRGGRRSPRPEELSSAA